MPGCDEPPPPGLTRGIEQFNRGEYWECHETLEALWIAEPRTVRGLYQGILQVGVALHHLRNENLPGALKVFRRGLPKLHRLPDVCQGVDVKQLIEDATAVYEALPAQGSPRPERLPACLPQIRLDTHAVAGGHSAPKGLP